MSIDQAQSSNNFNNVGDEIDYKINKLDLLAFPRNQIPVCDLTGAKANIQLVTGQYTLYYASNQLASQAWESIIHKIVHLFPSFFRPPQIVGTDEELQQYAHNTKHSKKVIADFCMKEAANYLKNKNYAFAIPSVVQALRFYQDVDGDTSLGSNHIATEEAQHTLGLLYFFLVRNEKSTETLGSQSDGINLQDFKEKHESLQDVGNALSFIRQEYSKKIDTIVPEEVIHQANLGDTAETANSPLENNEVPMTARERVRFKSMLVHIPRNEPVVAESAESSLPPSAILYDQLVHHSHSTGSGDSRENSFHDSSMNAPTTAVLSAVSTTSAVPDLLISNNNQVAKNNSRISFSNTAANAEVPMTARTYEKVHFKSMLQVIPRNEPVVEDTTGALPPSAILFENIMHKSSLSQKDGSITPTDGGGGLIRSRSNSTHAHAHISIPPVETGTTPTTESNTATSPSSSVTTPTENEVPMSARERVRFKSMLVHIPRNEPVVAESAESSLPPSAILYDQLVHHSGNTSGSTSARLSGRRSSKDMSSRKHVMAAPVSAKNRSISNLFGEVTIVDIPSAATTDTTAETDVEVTDTDVPMTARTIERVRFKSMLVHIPRNEPIVEDTTGALPPSAILYEHLVHCSGSNSVKSSFDSDTADSHRPSLKSTSGNNRGHVAISNVPNFSTATTVTATEAPGDAATEPEVPMTARTYERVHFKTALQVIPRNEPIVEESLDHSLPPSAILFQQLMLQSSSTSSSSRHLKIETNSADPSITTSLPYESEFPLSGRENSSINNTGIVSDSTRSSINIHNNSNSNNHERVHFTSKTPSSSSSSLSNTEKSKTIPPSMMDNVQVEIIPRPADEVALDMSDAASQKPPSEVLFEHMVETSQNHSHNHLPVTE